MGLAIALILIGLFVFGLVDVIVRRARRISMHIPHQPESFGFAKPGQRNGTESVP